MELKEKIKNDIMVCKAAVEMCKLLKSVNEDLRSNIIDDIYDLDIDTLETRIETLESLREAI